MDRIGNSKKIVPYKEWYGSGKWTVCRHNGNYMMARWKLMEDMKDHVKIKQDLEKLNTIIEKFKLNSECRQYYIISFKTKAEAQRAIDEVIQPYETLILLAGGLKRDYLGNVFD